MLRVWGRVSPIPWLSKCSKGNNSVKELSRQVQPIGFEPCAPRYIVWIRDQLFPLMSRTSYIKAFLVRHCPIPRVRESNRPVKPIHSLIADDTTLEIHPIVWGCKVRNAPKTDVSYMVALKILQRVG